jgi:hypothetical protein
MPPTNRTDPLGRQLEIYEESWKTDHEEVKRVVLRFEDKLAVGLALFKAIHDRYWTWRDRIISGAEEYDPQEEQEFKERFAWWLRPCGSVMRQLEQVEARYGAVEGGQQFCRFYREARQVLETWTAPEPLTQEATSAYELEDVPADTDRALTLEKMAEVLGQVSRPSEQPSVPLKHPIDYNQAF